ncbi:antA/AntB antirepressor family protein [Larkinella rosea]|uniref:AntA/AntB antirepressor domain-containing protein n=1 Tax=Larkinella rosea TaxID=2025312 RepID=A0A3P1BZ92_9BACT|nr:antA/AntB antirepressor family protein [Larkinella rosea]RRB06292.1 hypothetical protein EHT25_00355 [Larkinella rosea]
MTTSESNQTNPPISWPDYVLFHGQKAVISARRLYASFQNKNDRYFPDWFNHRVDKFDLVHDRHFSLKKLFRGRVDYVLTVETAQHLAAYERDPEGIYRQQLAAVAERLQKEGMTTDFGDQLNEVPVNLEGLKDAHGRSLELFPPTETTSSNEISRKRPIAELPDSDLTPAQVILQAAKLLVEHEQQINALQAQMSQMVSIQQQSAVQFMGMNKSVNPPPQQTVRSRIRELVNDYCHINRLQQDQVYPQIYHKLLYIYNINVKAYKRTNSETYLDVAERHGFLDKVLSVVTHHFKPTPNPPGGGPLAPGEVETDDDDDQPF